jgi:16S rRNA processing protein RimM
VSEATPDRIAVGLVRGLHGLDGAVRVEPLTDNPDRFVAGAELLVDGEEAPLTITWTGPSKPGVLVRFEGVSSREAAERLRDRYLEVAAEQVLPEGSWYWHQIVGLAVTTREGTALGNVVDIFRAGEAEVYVVRGGERGEVLIPAIADVVVELDPPGGKMVVDAGVLALESTPLPRRRKRHAKNDP